MKISEQNKKALQGSSNNAQKAIDVYFSPDYSHVPEAEKTAYAMAALIHCDMCRLIIAFDECERDGIARLLWMSDIVSKLNEAKRWYFEKGIKLLIDISKSKSIGEETALEKIKAIKIAHPIGKIEKYTQYRNRLGYHYDSQAINYLSAFGKENAEDFYSLLQTFSIYSGEWAKITKSIIQDEATLTDGREPKMA